MRPKGYIIGVTCTSLLIILLLIVQKYSFGPLTFDPEVPIQDIFYTDRLNTDRSVFVVPRRAYIDNRIVGGKPRNLVMILAEVHDSALSYSIAACEIDQNHSKAINLNYELLYTRWVRSYHGGTHRIVLVECVGLDTSSVTNGSSTYLIYRKKGDNYYSRVKTEMPLFIHRMTMKAGSTFACATVYGQPKRLSDWLRYQKTLGVDLVHLNVHTSFAKEKYPVLNESLLDGFVRMDVWEDIVGERMFYHSQITKYQDCLYRYIGVYEYGIFYDVDDFLNPVLPDHKDIHYYLNREFSDPKIGTVCFKWVRSLCGPIRTLHKALTTGNVTSILSGHKSVVLKEMKCSHRLNSALLISTHKSHSHLPGAGKKVKVDKHQAYVAHNQMITTDCR